MDVAEKKRIYMREYMRKKRSNPEFKRAEQDKNTLNIFEKYQNDDEFRTRRNINNRFYYQKTKVLY